MMPVPALVIEAAFGFTNTSLVHGHSLETTLMGRRMATIVETLYRSVQMAPL